MVRYVNQHPGLAIDVALVELQCFWAQENNSWPLLVVPRVVARTEIIERSVVQVTVVQGQAPQVEVKQERAQSDHTAARKVTLTEEAFWELMKTQAHGGYDAARQLAANYAARDGVEPSHGDSSITWKLDIQGTGRKVSLFYIDSKARLNIWPATISDQLRKANLDPTITRVYDEEIRQILSVPDRNRVFLSRSIIDVDLDRFRLVVDNFIQRIQQAQPVEEE